MEVGRVAGCVLIFRRGGRGVCGGALLLGPGPYVRPSSFVGGSPGNCGPQRRCRRGQRTGRRLVTTTRRRLRPVREGRTRRLLEVGVLCAGVARARSSGVSNVPMPISSEITAPDGGETR